MKIVAIFLTKFNKTLNLVMELVFFPLKLATHLSSHMSCHVEREETFICFHLKFNVNVIFYIPHTQSHT